MAGLVAAVSTAVKTVGTWAAGLPSGVSTALSLGGTALSTVGAIQASNAQAAAARANAETAEYNAKIEAQNRADALRLANRDVEAKRRENRRLLSTMRASYGASGLSMAGSPLDVLEDAAFEMELDVNNIEAEGDARAKEASRRMYGYQQEAGLERGKAKTSRTAGFFNALGSGASGVGQTLQRVA